MYVRMIESRRFISEKERKREKNEKIGIDDVRLISLLMKRIEQ